MGSCAAPSAKGDDKFITTDYLQQCHLDSQGAIYLCESAKAGAVLIFWHELAINGYASMNAIKRQELIDADFQRLRNLIWPEDDR
ncbi:hypothetical protein [Klebsiella quasipneumoniae]|uniref:hypothetical protein n=1 Tax=Klebsiella quasipneumoniae TaxID=1463165 RepID=UPI0018892273|nr:hypothetical protein [Klebsiella quasipneumoniae]MBF2766815.1 hypothetical protein [Klebsiella quasipneumoniae]QPP88889.1 hypothetical protein I5M56_26120 [Klebsiella quasipneumoniae]